MNEQVQRLILLQDLDLMITEYGDGSKANAEKKLGFDVGDPNTLVKARDELASGLPAELLKRYERLRGRYARPIVPVKDGVCFGCFVRQPTRRSVDLSKQDIEFCERCARILFRIQLPPSDQE